jgi:hypothetical protein
MTEQVPDSCTFDGRRWCIDEWNGPFDGIPSNEILGLRTTSPHTANWRGRIDHFMVHRDVLYLFKIEATLSLADMPRLPTGARREVVKQHLPLEVIDASGSRNEIRIERYDFFIFDNLVIPFSGKLYLSYPYFDYWEVPWPIKDGDEGITDKIILAFDRGAFVGKSPR